MSVTFVIGDADILTLSLFAYERGLMCPYAGDAFDLLSSQERHVYRARAARGAAADIPRVRGVVIARGALYTHDILTDREREIGAPDNVRLVAACLTFESALAVGRLMNGKALADLEAARSGP